MTACVPAFDVRTTCDVCGGAELTAVHELIFELAMYATQDPELASYSGQTLALMRCAACGFAQPSARPSLPRFFDRLYDQRWSDEWIASEFEADYKRQLREAYPEQSFGTVLPFRRVFAIARKR